MKFFVYILLIFSIINLDNFIFANDKIVYLNVNYVFNNSVSGNKANTSIEKKIKILENNLNQFKKDVDIKKDKLIKQKNILSETDYNEKFTEIDDEIKEFNKKVEIQKKEINNLRREVRSNFSKELRKILNDYSTKNSIDIIIKKEDILLGSKKLDITDEILKIINSNNVKLIK